MDNESIFSPPEVELPPSSSPSPSFQPPLISSEEKPKPIYYIILALVALALGVATFFLVRSLRSSAETATARADAAAVASITEREEDGYSPTDSALTLRYGMYNALESAASNGADLDALTELLNSWITYPTSDETKNSLSIFATYILLDLGYSDDALSHYNNLILRDDLSLSDLCELSAYRYLIASVRNSSTSDLEGFAYTHSVACASAPAGDGTFAMAKTLFFSGFYASAISSLQSIDLATLEPVDIIFSLSLLSRHYALTRDEANFAATYATLQDVLTAAYAKKDTE
ncbi:hypothetical protein IJI02_00490 [Candidatus Saccharibacteria bacterium]|nr:hypothetical protein [Candidatus Saccharibacteria bacterium]